MCSSTVLAELRRAEIPGCDLEDDCNLNTLAVSCDVRQQRANMLSEQRAVDSPQLQAEDVLVNGACRTALE